ncbi:MAG: hypothetical protein A2840_00995 [Candidatus Buchananbacteria bacterium RIFCSPHIGHO2_01_FULL_47_11b]|uniref:Glycosyltransferase 2-like domain-containing protein n=1 Tax=Candidatus Buchananbacteria bacterium RIFCSPHIGHO2_01_FULL_47_11b TaxID=1797537 RepID=A0A1G1Y5V2_9BACT|nr:MAG: hypothetical protein A2840_00995 [Candidatus Buchananbacteria bacterium RIFCSPHIGHO2_01_FULL_47_11b]
MARTLMIVPTYNEQGTIKQLIEELLALPDAIDVLVVDDGSDDTEKIVRQIMVSTPRVSLIKRAVKSGRGTAVIEGLKFGLNKDYEYLAEMDADFSHPPSELPELLKLAGPNKVVIASRYVQGSRIENWPISRRIFSKFANFYANLILRIGIRDYTTGYRIYGREALKKIDLGSITSIGYIVLSEIAYRLHKAGAEFVERSTVFVNRSRGASNFSLREVTEAFSSVIRLKKRLG